MFVLNCLFCLSVCLSDCFSVSTCLSLFVFPACPVCLSIIILFIYTNHIYYFRKITMQITEIEKLTFRALALRQSESRNCG